MWMDVERSGSDMFLEGLSRTTKNFRLAGVTAEIPSEHLPNTSRKHCYLTNLLSNNHSALLLLPISCQHNAVPVSCVNKNVLEVQGFLQRGNKMRRGALSQDLLTNSKLYKSCA